MTEQEQGVASVASDRPQPEAKVSHTPGPWVVREQGPHGYIDQELCRYEVIEGNGDEYVVAAIIGDVSELAEQGLHNARLIAAAPDLLEALREAKQGAEYPDDLGDIIDAAIAQAEGRSS